MSKRQPWIMHIQNDGGKITATILYAGLKSGDIDTVEIPLGTATRLAAELTHAIHMAIKRETR